MGGSAQVERRIGVRGRWPGAAGVAAVLSADPERPTPDRQKPPHRAAFWDRVERATTKGKVVAHSDALSTRPRTGRTQDRNDAARRRARPRSDPGALEGSPSRDSGPKPTVASWAHCAGSRRGVDWLSLLKQLLIKRPRASDVGKPMAGNGATAKVVRELEQTRLLSRSATEHALARTHARYCSTVIYLGAR